jgi:hypothetical protein
MGFFNVYTMFTRVSVMQLMGLGIHDQQQDKVYTICIN